MRGIAAWGFWIGLVVGPLTSVGSPADPPVWSVPTLPSVPGLQLVRDKTKEGWGPPRVVFRDSLVIVDLADRPGSWEQPRLVEIPTCVAGVISAESSAHLLLKARQPVTVAIDVFARRMGSPLDPVIRVRNRETGREVRGGSVDDSRGLGGDCRAILRLEPGDYCLEIRDALHRGGPDYRFCVRLTESPWLPLPMPVSVQRGIECKVQLGATTIPLTASQSTNALSLLVKPDGAPDWPAQVLVGDDPEEVEREPNDGKATANELPTVGGISGRFDRAGDRDWYVWRAAPGTKVRFTAITAALGSPAEVDLSVFDADGKKLAASDPSKAFCECVATQPPGGACWIRVESLTGHHGMDHVYRVAAAPTSRVSLTLPELTCRVEAGQLSKIRFKLVREDFEGPVAVRVDSERPGLSGTLDVPDKAQGDQTLELRATDDATPGPATIRLVASIRVGERVHRFWAQGRDALRRQLHNMPDPPIDWVTAIAVEVTPPNRRKDKP